MSFDPYKLTSLPSNSALKPNSIYFVQVTSDLFDLYVTNNVPAPNTAARRINSVPRTGGTIDGELYITNVDGQPLISLDHVAQTGNPTIRFTRSGVVEGQLFSLSNSNFYMRKLHSGGGTNTELILSDISAIFNKRVQSISTLDSDPDTTLVSKDYLAKFLNLLSSISSIMVGDLSIQKEQPILVMDHSGTGSPIVRFRRDGVAHGQIFTFTTGHMHLRRQGQAEGETSTDIVIRDDAIRGTEKFLSDHVTVDSDTPDTLVNKGFLDSKILAPQVCQVVSTNSTHNVNNTAWTTVPITGTQNLKVGTLMEVSGDGIKCNFAGVVKVNTIVAFSATAARAAPIVRIVGGSAPLTVIGKSGYIRAASGHNEASIHINGLFVTVADGDVITVETQKEGNTGVATMLAGGSMLSIERVT